MKGEGEVEGECECECEGEGEGEGERPYRVAGVPELVECELGVSQLACTVARHPKLPRDRLRSQVSRLREGER